MADILKNAFKDVADAIRAKGVSGTMTPLEMPDKIRSLHASGGVKYGADVDDFLPDLSNGTFNLSSNPLEVYSTEIISIGTSRWAYKFYRNSGITSFSLPNLTTIGEQGIYYGLRYCTSLATVNLPSVTSIEALAFRNCFQGDTSLTTVRLNKLSSCGTNALTNAFTGCTALEVVDFSEATAVPALSNTNAFSSTNSTYKIVVPDALYSSWKTTTNWSNSSIVGHIIKKSDYDAL